MDQSPTENNPDSAGILYVATGQKFLDEAIRSATSCRAHMPQVPIHIFTDIPTSHSAFSSVTVLPKAIYRSGDKILPLMESPFQRTVFLDTDTYACGGFEELFDLLNSFDVVGAHSPKRASYRLKNHPVPEEARQIPSAFSEVNTGVLGFRKNSATDQLFREWHFWYMCALKRGDNNGKPLDQPSFRVALFQSKCRYHIVTAEYNCRFEHPMAHCGRVKILHGRAEDLSHVARVINSDPSPRAYVRGQLFLLDGQPAQIHSAEPLPASQEEWAHWARGDANVSRPRRRPHFTERYDPRRPVLSIAAWRLRKLLRHRIFSGPFKTVKFHKPGTGVTYYAKLLGTYEMELHSVIEELCRTPIARVVNVGAGDGYYAIGLACRMAYSPVIAFEAQVSRHAIIKRLAEINRVLPRVRLAGKCDPQALSRALEPGKLEFGRSLVFMDVEGAEEELLDLKLVPHLQSAYIVVEIHEGPRPGISSRIAKAFESTHSLSVISIRRRYTEDFPVENCAGLLFSRSVRQTLMHENRRGSTGWFYLRPKA